MQPVGVRGDADHPLLERPPEDREVAPLGAAVGGDLLVGQDGPQAGAPVDQRLVAVGEAVGVDDLAALDVGELGPRPARRVRARRRLAGAVGQLGFELADRAGPVGLRRRTSS